MPDFTLPFSTSRLLSISVVALVYSSISATGISAQTTGSNRGFAPAPERTQVWLGVTVGAGGTALTCDICQPARDLGPSVDVSVGAHASPRLRVGVEVGAWTHDEDDDRESVYRGGVVAQLVPLEDRGLYLLGGFGWSGYRAGDFHYDAPRISVGTGWDLPVTGSWIIGSQLILDASSLGSLKNDDTTVVRRVGLSTIRLSIHLRRG